MIFSAFGVYLGATSEQSDEFEYKDHTFKFKEGKYWLKGDRGETPFYNLPQELEFVNLSKEATALIKQGWLLQIVFDPSQENLEYIELTRFDWNRWWGKTLINGVLVPSGMYPNLPVITCINATEKSPVIYLNSSSPSSETIEGNCLILNGLGIDFLRWRDQVLYLHLGVIA